MAARARLRRARRALDDDQGSLVLALLATIVVGGLVTVVVASVLAGQRSVRFDEEFTGVLHVAEAGVEQAVYRLNQGQDISGQTFSDEDAAVNDVTYEWSAEEIGEDDWEVWEVTSTAGQAGELQRTVRAIVEDKPLFDLAAFSDVLVNYAGSNTADSYHSSEGEWCTGVGRVGSNDELDFSGASSGQCDVEDEDGTIIDDATVDGVDLFDWQSYSDPDRCVQAAGTPNNCWVDTHGGEPRFDTHDDPIEFNPQIDWAQTALDTCASDNDLRGDVLASEFGGHIPPADYTDGPRLNEDDDDSPYVYCVESLTFDEDTTLDSASQDDPVVFVVEHYVDVPSHTLVNCEGCQSGGEWKPKDEPVYPEAGALQIYTPSDHNPEAGSDDVVAIRQHARVSAALFAPWGTCGGVGNAAVHLFGSMICGDIRNAGGWEFHYDEALRSAVRTGEFEVSRWSED